MTIELEKVFPYKEQSVMMFSYSAFIELLKYQKEKITNSVVWDCYISALQKQINQDLEKLKEYTCDAQSANINKTM